MLLSCQIPWPAFVADMWSTSGSGSSLPLSGGFVSCTLALGFYGKFWMVVLSPIVLCSALLLIPLAGRVSGGHASWTAYRCAVLVSTYLLYPSVSRSVVQALACSRPIDGTSYLEADYREVCGTGTQLFHAVVAVVVIAVFCIGFPLFTAVVLRRQHKRGQLHSEDTRRVMLFLFGGYKEEWCFWESVVCMRKLALAIAGSAVSQGSGQQAYVALLVLTASLVCQMGAQPYASSHQGRLETASLMTSVSTLFMGMLFLLGNFGTFGETVALCALVAVNAAFAVWLVVQLLTRGCSRLRARRGVARRTRRGKPSDAKNGGETPNDVELRGVGLGVGSPSGLARPHPSRPKSSAQRGAEGRRPSTVTEVINPMAVTHRIAVGDKHARKL